MNSIIKKKLLPTLNLQRHLDFLQLIQKGVRNLINWGMLLDLNENTVNRLSNQKTILKNTNTVFGLHKFFTKPVKLYKTCEKLKSELDQNCGLAQMVKNMKKVTCAFFGFIGSLFKLALLLNKANFIALKQISPDLPKVLKKTGALLTLGTASMCLIENSWAITSFFNKSRSSSQPDLQALFGSSKFKKLGIRFASEVFNTGVAILDVASLFCGWYLSPIVLVSLSTVSFINSLASKIFQDHEINFLYKQNFEEVSMDVQLPV